MLIVMTDEITDRVRSIDDHRAALVVLTKRLLAANPTGLEALARDLSADLSTTLQHAAVTSLRVVTELPEPLEGLAATIADPRLEIGLRLGLRAVLRGVIRHAEIVPSAGCEAATLLEPALLLHALLTHLQPWLPLRAPRAEPAHVLAALSLGVRDFMFPLLISRVSSSWRRFHRLRALGPEQVDLQLPPGEFDDTQLARLLGMPAALAALVPPAPKMWVPWPEADAPVPRAICELGSLERAGN
jgi:hypothetical protein